jgi:hypothetical protein
MALSENHACLRRPTNLPEYQVPEITSPPEDPGLGNGTPCFRRDCHGVLQIELISPNLKTFPDNSEEVGLGSSVLAQESAFGTYSCLISIILACEPATCYSTNPRNVTKTTRGFVAIFVFQ